MEHLLLKAATTATDEGTFEAVISTATVDRDGDVVEPKAMVAALKKWADIDKLVPLAWAHTDEVIGHIDPASARIDGDEVIAKGWVDQSTPRGEEAWRLVKSGTFSFSFGYLIPEGGATKLDGGRFHITALDIFEISGVPVGPANNDTRVLSYKSAAELREEAKRVERELEAGRLPELPPPVEPEEPATEPPTVDAVVEMLKALPDEGLQTLRRALGVPEPKSAPVLREGAKRAAREVEATRLPEMPPTSRKRLASDLREQLDAAGAERWGQGQDRWAWLDDYDPEASWAVFHVGDDMQRRFVRVAYIVNADGTVTLGDEETEVVRSTSYRVASDPNAEPFKTSPELQEVKEALAQTERALEDLKEKADETDREPRKARSVDPLRKQAEAVALEVASGGLRTPPPTPAPKPPEPALSLRELKQRTRDELLGVLSGGPIA